MSRCCTPATCSLRCTSAAISPEWRSCAWLAPLLHSGGQLAGFLGYFIAPDGGPRLSSFGLGNWTGLAATVIVLGLLALSSDLALRTLTAKPWKRLQRLNYALFALVIAHAFFYGAVLRMTSPFTLLLVLGVITVLVGQAAGVWLWRRRRSAVRAPLPSA